MVALVPVLMIFNNCDEMPSNPQLVFGCVLSIVFEIISSFRSKINVYVHHSCNV